LVKKALLDLSGPSPGKKWAQGISPCNDATNLLPAIGKKNEAGLIFLAQRLMVLHFLL
jgi:hypothetical protein